MYFFVSSSYNTTIDIIYKRNDRLCSTKKLIATLNASRKKSFCFIHHYN